MNRPALTVLLATLCMTGPARADEVTADVVVLSLAAVADTASTHYALSRCLGCREGNPIMREPAGALLLKAGAVAATSTMANKLRKDGHGRAAKVLRWTVAAVWVGMAAHNMRTR